MKRISKKIISTTLIIAMIMTIAPAGQIFNVSAAEDDNTSYNLSEGRPVSVSSGDNEDYAVDGNTNTRWQANQSDTNEWLYVDLGKVATIDYLYLHFETAYAKYYQIQVSNDETSWTTVYTKEKAATSNVEMAISYKYTGVRADGDLRFNVNWTSVEDAHYKVYIDGEDDTHIAYAGGDNYRFTNHGGTQGDVRMSTGEHTLTVIAFDPDSKKELGRGTVTLDAQENAQGNNGVEVDSQAALKQTISAADWSTNKARYVKIVTTERATAYGTSLYEFQVWGIGGTNKRPANYGKNLALNQPVKCSGTRDEWWMKDSDGNITESAYNQIKPENAVDGNTSTAFTSYQGEDDQWIYVDLGKAYDIGRIVTRFSADGAKIYDIQVSANAKNWTTIHRNLRGYMDMIDMFTCYQTGVRYVKILAYSKVESGSGVGVRELEVYEYVEGDSKENEEIVSLPISQINASEGGKGSYVSGEVKKELNKLPTFVNEDKVKTPIDSNSWWSSAMIKTFGNRDIIHPLMAQYSKKGLGITLGSQGFTDERKEDDLGVGYYAEHLVDFYVLPDGLEGSSSYDRVEGYGDYHVDLGLCDEDGLKMESTFVKGSPYIFSKFYDTDIVIINSSSITNLFDGNGNEILKNAGDSIKSDHIGFTSVDEENTRANNNGSNFVICAPQGTTFTAMTVGSKTKIKVEFASKDDAYLSFGAILNKDDIDTYYKHGYAHVTDTKVNYTYSKDTSKNVTTYQVTTESVRDGFSDVTMQAFYPHQWKHSSDTDNPDAVYPSIRGNMKAKFANTLTTVQQFAGLLPTFAKPDSDKLNYDEIKQYIEIVMNEIGTGPNADAYWQGKAIHPLAITALMADQIGETGMRDQLLKDLKKILVDWFTYSGGDDRCYLIYNKAWGTIYYPESAYGANAAICDHHFTYGYFLFGASVLSAYDKEFYNNYKDMVELMLRDYANPDEPEDDGNMFCKFRSFDQYSGHSWAGGYADNDDGNNQESASESLFSWVGMYLWGEVSKQQKYLDAGAYGFTTEMEAIKQYWFDYDGDNWLSTYPFEGTGQIYGSTYSYGTFFGGQPLYIYGIQWLPISEYLTNYGMDQEKCAAAYQGLLDETDYAANIELRKGNITSKDQYANADNGWQHITWPFLSQTDPELAYEKFEAGQSGMQKEDRANTLWFISAMDSIGYRTNDYAIVGQTIGGSVYKKVDGATTTYTGEVWNPTGGVKTVYVIDTNTGEKIGKVKINTQGLVQFKIDPEGGFNYVQTKTPKIQSTGVESGDTKENISGSVSYDEAQIVTLTCADEDTAIYYTTDGSLPTTKSNKYEGQFTVSSNTTVKAYAVKEGSIDSSYTSCNMEINVYDPDNPLTVKEMITNGYYNVALGKKTKVSSIYKGEGSQTADVLTDGNINSSYVATDWDSSRTSENVVVDLGRTYNTSGIDMFAVQFVNQSTYATNYTVEISEDGTTYKKVTSGTSSWAKSDNGLLAVSFDDASALLENTRYVRITFNGHLNWGYQMREVAVISSHMNAKPIGEEPEPEEETDAEPDTSLKGYVNTSMNLAKGAKAIINTLDTRDEGTKDPKKLTDGDITGPYLMTTWGEDSADVTLELAESHDASEINEVLIQFVNNITYAKAFNVQFSSDGETYETVAAVTNAAYEDPTEVKVDTSTYTQNDVQFIKINFTQKSSGYGYQMREIAVMGYPENYLPNNPENLTLRSPKDGQISASFTTKSQIGQTYRIYIDETLVGMNISEGGTYTFNHLDGGNHKVKVTSVLNGIESSGITSKIQIDGVTVPEETDVDDELDEHESITRSEPPTQSESTTQSESESHTNPDETTKQVETTKEPESVTNDDATSEITTNETTTSKELQTADKSTTIEQTTEDSTKKLSKVKIKKIIYKKKSAKKIIIKIKKVKDAKGYQVRIYDKKSKAKKNKKPLIRKTIGENTKKLIIKNKKLKNKKKLFIRVRAYNLHNKKKIFGQWSKIRKVKIY